MKGFRPLLIFVNLKRNNEMIKNANLENRLDELFKDSINGYSDEYLNSSSEESIKQMVLKEYENF